MKKIHRAWFVLIGCCLIQTAVLGIIFNCRGVFFDPICDDLGFSLSDLTDFGMYFGVSCCLAMTLVPKLFESSKTKTYLLALSAILGLCQYCCSFFNAVWQWYIAAIIQGICCAFVYSITVTTVINNWFNEKKGFALGVAGACPALMGAIMNPVISSIITNNGWRIGYKVLGIIFLALIIPAYLFFVKIKPGQNERAYGEKITGINDDITGNNPGKTTFSFLFTVSAIAACLTCFTQHLNRYGRYLGNIPNPSLLASMSMLGNFLCKFLIGDLADRKGITFASTLNSLFLIIGFILLNTDNYLFVYSGSFFIGVSTSINIVIVPLLVRRIYGNRNYAKRMSRFSMAQNLFNSLGISVYGFMINNRGYGTALWASLLMSLLSLLLILFTIYLNKKEFYGNDH